MRIETTLSQILGMPGKNRPKKVYVEVTRPYSEEHIKALWDAGILPKPIFESLMREIKISQGILE